ncbi:MAG: sensor histidine kinase [Vicinamibacteria bacterium]
MRRVFLSSPEIRKETVELSDSVHQALDSVRDLLKHNHRELLVKLPSRPVYLMADSARMEQILGNVLSNAVKYKEDSRRIELSAERGDDEVVIRIRDDGQGLPEDALAVVFEPFVGQAPRHYFIKPIDRDALFEVLVRLAVPQNAPGERELSPGRHPDREQ